MKALSITLCCVIGVQLAVPPAYSQNPPTQIQIVVVEGEGAIYHEGQKAAQDTIVRVQNEAQVPIPDASVVFTLPTEGPSGEFGNGSKTLIVNTDARGQAAATGLRVNRTSGKLQIHVNASYRGTTARTNITQFVMNVPGTRTTSSRSGKTILIILSVAGVAAGASAYALTRGGSSGTPTGVPPSVTPIAITPGTGTVGTPR